MLGLGLKKCSFCGARVATQDAWRAPDRAKGYVCRSCYETWARAGKKCDRCQRSVGSFQTVGAFFDQRALGHTECGGLRIFFA